MVQSNISKTMFIIIIIIIIIMELMRRTQMVLEMLVHSPFNHLMRLLA